jgi:hypothetical protein
MEKRILPQFENFLLKFKNDIQKKIIELSFNETDKTTELLECIFEYEKFVFNKPTASASNASLNKPPISDEVRCCALRKNGQRCTRKKTKGNIYCSSHYSLNTNNNNHSQQNDISTKLNQRNLYKTSNNTNTQLLHSNTDNIDENIGIVTNEQDENFATKDTKEVFVREIQGIIYYLDNDLNVYNTEDIVKNIKNPKIIAKAVQLGSDCYSIPSLGL